MQFQFDATTVQPNSGNLPPIPAGWYPAVLTASELKDTSKGDGKYLNFQFQVIDGEYKGRSIFTRLNVMNHNPVTQEFAYKDLSAICHAVNVLRMQDTQELHNKPLNIKVKVKSAEGDYEASNEINGYRSITDNVAGQATAAPGMSAPVANPAATAPAQPWQTSAPAQAPAQAQAAAPAPWQQPAAAPAQQAAQQPAQAPVAGTAPPWAQQPAAPAAQQPAAQPAAPAPAAAPPWAAGAAAAGTAPPWAQQPQQ